MDYQPSARVGINNSIIVMSVIFMKISVTWSHFATLFFQVIISFTSEVGRIGIGICYDIRFQELAMLYAARGWCLNYPSFKFFSDYSFSLHFNLQKNDKL